MLTDDQLDLMALPEAVQRALLDELGRVIASDRRPESLALTITGEAVRVDLRVLLAAELRRDGLRRLARDLERARPRPGTMVLLLVGDDGPALRTIDVAALRRRAPRIEGAT